MPQSARLVCLIALLSLALNMPASRAEDKLAEMRARMDAVMDGEAERMVAEAEDPAERADTALAIGAIYEMGLMGEPDPIKAINFFLIASELDSAEADCALGAIHALGAQSRSGILNRDIDAAVEYYSQAAAGGSVKAMLELGRLYGEGAPGLERDSKKALAHFMDAASRGNPEALERIDPIMQQAKLWEEEHPGRKANFPTDREQLIKPELARADAARNDQLDKTASHVYVELNRRVAALTGKLGIE